MEIKPIRLRNFKYAFRDDKYRSKMVNRQVSICKNTLKNMLIPSTIERNIITKYPIMLPWAYCASITVCSKIVYIGKLPRFPRKFIKDNRHQLEVICAVQCLFNNCMSLTDEQLMKNNEKIDIGYDIIQRTKDMKQ